MDFAKLDTATASEAGLCVTLRHTVTGEPLRASDGSEIWIAVAGRDSVRYRRAMAAAARRSMSREADGAMTDDEKVDFAHVNLVKTVSDLVTDWHPEIELDGSVLPPNAANAERLFLRCPDIMEQVDQGGAGRGRFLAASATA